MAGISMGMFGEGGGRKRVTVSHFTQWESLGCAEEPASGLVLLEHRCGSQEMKPER